MICQYINEQQVVKVIWHKAALPQQTDGSIVNPMRAHYRHLANMTELVLPLAHQSPQLKRQIDWFSNFCTAYGRVSSGMPGHVLSPNNCLFAWWIWAHLKHASLGSPESITQMAYWSVQPFLDRWLQSVHILYNGMPLPPLKLPLPMGGSGSHLIWFPASTRVLNPNGISISSAVFAGLTTVTDRHYSVKIGCIYVCNTAMRPNNTINIKYSTPGLFEGHNNFHILAHPDKLHIMIQILLISYI